ncbi:MAG: GNAT family N-acetyltransferase [Candidatus Excrementavichristensenella sp.]
MIVESLQAYSDLLAPFRRAPVGNNLLMPAQVSEYIRQGCLSCEWTPDCLVFARDVGSHIYLYLSARGEDVRLPELPQDKPLILPLVTRGATGAKGMEALALANGFRWLQIHHAMAVRAQAFVPPPPPAWKPKRVTDPDLLHRVHACMIRYVTGIIEPFPTLEELAAYWVYAIRDPGTGEPVAGLLLKPSQGSFVVEHLFTKPTCRGLGLATAVLGYAMGDAFSREPTGIVTGWVEGENHPSFALYRRLGAVDSGKRSVQYIRP